MRRFGFAPVNDKVKRVAAAEFLLLQPRLYSAASLSPVSSSWKGSRAEDHYQSSWSRYYRLLAAFGAVGVGLEMVDSRYSPSRMIVQAANTSLAFGPASTMVQHHLRSSQFTLFEENRNPNTQKRRIFFMGGNSNEVTSVFSQGKPPLVLSESGHVVSPLIVDATLHPERTEKPGTCIGLTGLTADLSGLSTEVVFLTVPSESKVACTALHATRDNCNSDDQFVAAGLRSGEIFAALHRDPLTGCFTRATINPAFTGDLADLEIDFQMEKICELFPKSVEEELLRAMNPGIHYVDYYDYKLAGCKVSHAAGVAARKIYLGAIDSEESERHDRMAQGEYLGISFGGKKNVEKSDINTIRTEDGRVFVRLSGDLGQQRGGNEGGLFMDNNNHACYLKYGPADEMVRTDDEIEAGVSIMSDDPARMNESRFRNEVMVAKLYRLAGIRVPRTELFYFTMQDGKKYVGIASKYERDLVRYNSYTDPKGVYKEGWENNKFFQKALLRGALFDFLFGNYDAIGLGFDNTLGIRFRGTLNPIRIDVGAGFIFRAKGTPQQLDETADDFLTADLEPGNWFQWYEGSFGACYDELLKTPQFLFEALSLFKKVSPDDIAKTMRENGYSDPQLTERVIAATLKRREALIERAQKYLDKRYYAQVVEDIKDTRKKFEGPSVIEMRHTAASQQSPSPSSPDLPALPLPKERSDSLVSPVTPLSKELSGSFSVEPGHLHLQRSGAFRKSKKQEVVEVSVVRKSVERDMDRRMSASLRADVERRFSKLHRSSTFRIDTVARQKNAAVLPDTGIDYSTLNDFVAFQSAGSPKAAGEKPSGLSEDDGSPSMVAGKRDPNLTGEMYDFGECVLSEDDACPLRVVGKRVPELTGEMSGFGELVLSEDGGSPKAAEMGAPTKLCEEMSGCGGLVDSGSDSSSESEENDKDDLSIDSGNADRDEQEEKGVSTADLINAVLEESRERYWASFFKKHGVDANTLSRCLASGGPQVPDNLTL